MKIYFGLLIAFVLSFANAATTAECANGSCGKEVVETVSAKDVIVPPIPTATKKSKRPYTLDNCPYCSKRGCRWCE